ncbi:MAG TPA: hypothetical protein VEC38_12820 [Candidatus Binataceae bacterium]|nr:hypothetical protein [Candidatus Binataceae bacterium]
MGRRFGAILCALVLAAGTGACTHLFQTNVDKLPRRLDYPEFSFDRPQGDQWYLHDTLDPPNIVEFTKRAVSSERQIRVLALTPEGRVENVDQLTDWSEGLPDEDQVVRPDPGHGAVCVRYHGRSTMTVNYAGDGAEYADRMVTDEDSLECIDPHLPGRIVRFIYTQRSPTGGTADGARDADAFLASVKF